MRLTFISQAPTPYVTAILNELTGLVDLEVVFISGRHPATSLNSWATFRDPWGTEPRFRYSFVPSLPVTSTGSDFHAQVAFGVSVRLARLRPDIVLVHGWGLPMVEPMLWSCLAHRRVLMWSESTIISGLHRGRLSDLYRRSFVRHVRAFVTSGRQATDYLHELRVPASRIITSCLPAVPTTDLTDDLPTLGSDVETRPGPRFIFVGRLIPRKRPGDSVIAFRLASRALPDAVLTIVGDGPLLEVTKMAAADLGGRVRFVGRREGRDLGRQYRDADVLLAPFEREVWGLVVNEALQAGLYVIASDQVASAFDLLRPDTGVILPSGSIDDLARAMRNAAHQVDFSREARARRARSIADCNPRAFALAIREGAELAGGAR